MTQAIPTDDDTVSPPSFEPVQTNSSRRDGWLPERQSAFIAALNAMGAVAPAARAVGMSPRSAYKLRARPDAASFARAWDEALVTGRQHAFEIAIENAVHGVLVPRYYRGKQVGSVRRPDYRLLLAALRVPPPKQQSCEIDTTSANFANFEDLLAALTDVVDPPAPSP
jgi:hypothetical protein